MNYGKPPTVIGQYDLDWQEYMHYMYLPVVVPCVHSSPIGRVRLPERLRFLWPLLSAVLHEEKGCEGRYVYVTARRGFAVPGNPLNRPGWHTDGFGTSDVNYIWTDAYPTRFAVQPFSGIIEDHIISMAQFENQTRAGRVHSYPLKSLLRLDSEVVHSVPEIPAPGGERGFVKISVSESRYNLAGNSHNYLFDYDWKMWSRDEIRNDPSYAGGDSGPQERVA